MINLSGRRLVIAHNPHSTRSRQVKSQVFDSLDQAGYDYHLIEVQQASLAENVERLKTQIKPNDIVLSAGGDGSAHAVAHSVLAADQPNVSIGFLGYGNFNDLPHSLNKRRDQKDPLSLLENATEQTLYPLTILADNQPVRSALLYTTIGWTAKAAAKFDDQSSRQRVLQSGKANIIKSLWHAFKFYMVSRAKSDLADFTIDENRYSKRTDILFANSTALARLFKTGRNYGASKQFLMRVLRVRWLAPNAPFLLLGLLGHMSGRVRSGAIIKFEQTTNLPVQCDGEVFQVEAKNIEITKGQRKLTVISSR